MEFRHDGWGWTGWFPGAGLLADEVEGPSLHHWQLEDDDCAFRDPDAAAARVRVPFEPFCGVMGVAPREPGRLPTFDPGVHGGNVDVRQLTSGAKALLPVFNEGAGFATGDGHAAQGDGEVCCTAIEAPLTATMRFRLRRDLTVHELQVVTPHRSTRAGAQGNHCTTGHGPDLQRCAQDAVRHMVDWLEREHGLQRDHAYCLCSVAGDLKISQAVMGAKVVSFWMPLSVLRN